MACLGRSKKEKIVVVKKGQKSMPPADLLDFLRYTGLTPRNTFIWKFLTFNTLDPLYIYITSPGI